MVGRIVSVLVTRITTAARMIMIVAMFALLGGHLDERLSPGLAIVRG